MTACTERHSAEADNGIACTERHSAEADNGIAGEGQKGMTEEAGS
jgi:hypothetical protein